MDKAKIFMYTTEVLKYVIKKINFYFKSNQLTILVWLIVNMNNFNF